MNCRIILSEFLLITIASACEKLPPCTAYNKRFLSKETYLVVTDKGLPGRSFFIKGYNPVSKKEVIYSDGDGIYLQISARLNIGDTLFKRKGIALFKIMKNEIDITVSPVCVDKYNKEENRLESTYGDIKCDTLKK